MAKLRRSEEEINEWREAFERSLAEPDNRYWRCLNRLMTKALGAALAAGGDDPVKAAEWLYRDIHKAEVKLATRNQFRRVRGETRLPAPWSLRATRMAYKELLRRADSR